MLTFTSLGGNGLRVTGGPLTLSVFPAEKASPKEGILTLSALPDEEPRKGTVSWPGEYNQGGVSIRGVGHFEGQQVSYTATLDGVHCAFLSSPLQDWSDAQLESVPDIDVLAIPAEEVKLVQKLVDEFDPRVLLLLPSQGKVSPEILKAVGAQGSAVKEYKQKGALPAEGREVVVFG